MTCPHVASIELGASYTERLRRAVVTERVPASATMELTNRCNFRCAHCWISSPDCAPDPLPEMTTSECIEILDQLVEAGCLWLLLSGGDPLQRADFFEIYSAAKQRGLLVTINTNGAGLTPALVDQLRDLPPFAVEITLYGATEETHARMTGVSGGLQRVRRGIELLIDRSIRFRLKTVIHRTNASELDAMRKIAEEYGSDFSHDAVLNCGVQRETHPQRYRLTPQQVLALNLADEKWVRGMKAYIDEFGQIPVSTETVFSCGAGMNILHIDCHGQMTPCMMLRDRPIDIRGGRLASAWENEVKNQVRRSWATSSRCRSCELMWLCDQCSAWSWLEHGDFESPVDFLCEITHLIADEFGLTQGKKDDNND